MEGGTPIKSVKITWNIFAVFAVVLIWNVETVHETCNTKILNTPLGPDGTTKMEFSNQKLLHEGLVDLSKLEVMKFFKT